MSILEEEEAIERLLGVMETVAEGHLAQAERISVLEETLAEAGLLEAPEEPAAATEEAVDTAVNGGDASAVDPGYY